MVSDVVEYFDIAGLTIKMIYKNKGEDINYMSSFFAFKSEEPDEEPCMTVTVSDDAEEDKYEKLIGDYKTINTRIRVEEVSDGYRLDIMSVYGNKCCELHADSDFSHCHCRLFGNWKERKTGLNDALMLIYSYVASTHEILLIHSSVVVYKGKAYCFTAPSGTGKSTQTMLWMKNIPGCKILNDDNPIIQIRDDKVMVWGSPWSGKTQYYINKCYPLGAVIRIERAKKNDIVSISGSEAFAKFLPACSIMTWNHTMHEDVFDTVIKIIGMSDMYDLKCLPNRNSAILCMNTVTKQKAYAY